MVSHWTLNTASCVTVWSMLLKPPFLLVLSLIMSLNIINRCKGLSSPWMEIELKEGWTGRNEGLVTLELLPVKVAGGQWMVLDGKFPGAMQQRTHFLFVLNQEEIRPQSSWRSLSLDTAISGAIDMSRGWFCVRRHYPSLLKPRPRTPESGIRTWKEG